MCDPRRSDRENRGGSSRRFSHEEELPPDTAEEQPETPPECPDQVSLEDYDELMEKFQRLAAEFDNYRKRQARDFKRLIARGRRDLITELLTVLDNFDRARAIAQGEHSDKEIVDGIMQTSDQLKKILCREGLEAVIIEEGDLFDPNIHEAMFVEELDKGDSDIVLEVYQKAYRFDDDLIRPAMVKVGKVPGRNGG